MSRFIPNFSERVRPLVGLTTKEINFNWNQTHDELVLSLRKDLESCEVHEWTTQNEPKLVALQVLSQSVEVIATSTKDELIDRASRTLSDSELNYTRVEKTLLALILAYEKFGPILNDECTSFLTNDANFLKK